MVGVVTMRSVLRHPVLVVKGWGWSTLGRAVKASVAYGLGARPVTFLELVVDRNGWF